MANKTVVVAEAEADTAVDPSAKLANGSDSSNGSTDNNCNRGGKQKAAAADVAAETAIVAYGNGGKIGGGSGSIDRSIKAG